ncbi:Filamin-B [Sciurus carolinensis]|uniref:Filamin-B n=1 Tax=Sciurus carolinensis TaxID=30640 RepID=A0AA41NG11_SCICA|nr:Filamin-B [Sciurus carolinensis]
MPVTEKDLAEDAPWKKIQQNTFTRWCNEHLKCVNKRIGNLQTDLSDGLRLIALLEVLSQKRMYRKYHQRPTFRQMQLENVSVALEFLDRESIKLVSIGEYSGRAQAPEGVQSSPSACIPCERRGLPKACPHHDPPPGLGVGAETRGNRTWVWGRRDLDRLPGAIPGLGPYVIAPRRAPQQCSWELAVV